MTIFCISIALIMNSYIHDFLSGKPNLKFLLLNKYKKNPKLNYNYSLYVPIFTIALWYHYKSILIIWNWKKKQFCLSIQITVISFTEQRTVIDMLENISFLYDESINVDFHFDYCRKHSFYPLESKHVLIYIKENRLRLT